MSDISRRDLMVIAGATACACCMVQADDGQPHPDGDGPPRRRPDDGSDHPDRGPAKPAVKSLSIGKLADFAKPGFYDKFRPQKVMISRLDDRIVAMSAICTHKGCTVKIDANDATALQCPCHKAEFSDQGTATKGPAKTSLVRYAVTQAADGTITADLTKSFEERKWEDPAAFVAIPK